MTDEEKRDAIKKYSTLTFDCYGTLIDWESGIWDAMQPLLMANGIEHIDRQTGLVAFSTAETAQELATPSMKYPELLAAVHGAIAEKFSLTTNDQMDQAFGNSVPHWPAFADTADALRRLKKHFKLVILSNVNRDGFAASNKKLGVEFDAIYTAEDIGSYKPNPGNFSYLLDHLGADLNVPASAVLHTAQSLHHDHVMANQFGLANTWIDRQKLIDADNWGATAKVAKRPTFDFYFETMVAMADFVEQ